MEEAIFSCKDEQEHLRKLPINATDDEIITANGETLKLDNQKMVGKEYVYFRSITEMKNLSQFRRWGVDTSPFATRLETEKLSLVFLG